MSLTHLIERVARVDPKGLAVVCGNRDTTWQELQQRIAKLAGALQKLGVEPGDRVAILALNSDRYYEYFFAVFWAGGVAVPMNTRWSVPENIYSIEDCGPKVLIVDDAFVDHARRITDGTELVKTLIYSGDGDTPEDMLNFEALIAETEPVQDVSRAYGDLATIFYTGGTTGFPKGVMLSHGNLLANGLISAADRGGSKDGVYLHIAPLFHLGGFGGVIYMTVMGCTQVFAPSFDPKVMLEIIEKYQVSDTTLIVVMIKMLIEHPDFDKYDVSSLKNILYGGAPIPVELLREAMIKLPNVSFTQALGQTEMSPGIAFLMPDDHDPEGPNAHRLRSAGRPAMGVAIKVVDEKLQEVPLGETGEFMVTGPNAMMGYWNKPEQTAETLINGWILTGDAGYMDEDGYVYLKDRVKDMIVSGGENIYSAEVENAVTSHAAVDQAVVIGIPSEKWGETVHAIVILKDGCELHEEELIGHCKSLIASYKCPRSVEFRTEPFPFSGVAKVQKNELRKPYWEGQDRSIS